MLKNPFTDRPKESFAIALQKPLGSGGKASAKKSHGIAVDSLSNKRGVPPLQRRAA